MNGEERRKKEEGRRPFDTLNRSERLRSVQRFTQEALQDEGRSNFYEDSQEGNHGVLQCCLFIC